MEFSSPFDQNAIRRVFLDAFRVRDITHPLTGSHPASVETNGEATQRLPADAQMLQAMNLLMKYPLILVEEDSTVVGYVDGSSLNQLAARMWLFGLVGLIDRHFDVAIEICHPEGEWKDIVSPKRLEAARALQAERLREGHQADLLSCLQISDKIAILLSDPRMAIELGYTSKRQMKHGMKHLATLRNHLAHNQDIFPTCTEAALGMAERLDDLLKGSRLHHAIHRIRPPQPI